MITQDTIKQAYTYASYKKLIDDLLLEGKTTGTNQSPSMIQYTQLNVQRMERVEKTVTLSDIMTQKLNQIKQDWIWLVLAEAWCGDVPANLPVIAKMAEVSEHLRLKIILRDEHLDIMDQFLTNGGRAIPKLVCLNATTLEVIESWGPRPAPAQKIVMDYKAKKDEPYMEMVKRVQLWYAKDRGKTIQEEFMQLKCMG